MEFEKQWLGSTGEEKMAKKFLAITAMLIVSGLLVVGCESAPKAPTSSFPDIVVPLNPQLTSEPKLNTTTDFKLASVNTQIDEDMEIKLMNQTWVSPAEVKIGNFYPGARAEWMLRLHNGNGASPQTEMKSVMTGLDETTVELQLKKPLADASISAAAITSDNRKDILVITAYNPVTQSLAVAGFAPDAKRVVTITYQAWTAFFVDYMVSDTARPGAALAPKAAADWVIIEDSTPVLAPKETREIMIALDIPAAATVPYKVWEFWTVAGETSNAAIQTQMATRWLVNMR